MFKQYSNKGRSRSQWMKDKISQTTKQAMQNPKIKIKILGSNNSQWKGDKVSYVNLHTWVKRHKPKPELCENYKKTQPYDLANISGDYKRDIDDFKWICRYCHMKEDGRLEKINKAMLGKKGWQSQKTHCKHGHPFSGKNLIIMKSGYRRCRQCHNESYHELKKPK